MLRRMALLFGVVFVAVALLGFVTAGSSMESDPETAPRLLGLFPVNLLHNLVHLAFGAWGILAARSWAAARMFCTLGGSLYLVLALLGFVAPSLFGLVPIGGNDVWLHALLAVSMLFVGATARAETERMVL